MANRMKERILSMKKGCSGDDAVKRHFSILYEIKVYSKQTLEIEVSSDRSKTTAMLWTYEENNQTDYSNRYGCENCQIEG